MFLRCVLLLFLSVLSGCLFFDSSSTKNGEEKSDVSNDLVYFPSCLNGIVDDAEECDGLELDDNTCETLGFQSGPLKCSESCDYNTQDCVPFGCGNGVVDVDSGEDCDESSGLVFQEGITENSCSRIDSKYYSGGELRCENCQYDFDNCNFCGNGAIDGPEVCEGTEFLSAPLCSDDDVKRPRGEVSCGDDCSLDYSKCKREFVQVSVGEGHACAVMSDGEVACWGGTSSAQPPENVNRNFVKVSVGDEISCGLATNKNVRCWNRDGSRYLTEVISNVRQVSVGQGSLCVVRTNNKVDCYDGSTWTPRTGTYSVITVGTGFVCAMNLDASGINCWTTVGTITPTLTAAFSDSSNGFIFLSAGEDYVCGLTKGNEVECSNGISKDDIIQFDVGSDGICWTKATEQKCVYGFGDPPPLQFSQFSVGNKYACGVVSEETNKGTIVCWGTEFVNGDPTPLNDNL